MSQSGEALEERRQLPPPQAAQPHGCSGDARRDEEKNDHDGNHPDVDGLIKPQQQDTQGRCEQAGAVNATRLCSKEAMHRGVGTPRRFRAVIKKAVPLMPAMGIAWSEQSFATPNWNEGINEWCSPAFRKARYQTDATLT